MSFNQTIKEKILILDGAMGTNLFDKGRKAGESPSLLNLRNPDAVLELQRAYIEAGSNIILTNTFGADAMHFSSYKLNSIILKGIDIAKTKEVDNIVALIENTFLIIDGFSNSKIKSFIKTLSEFLIRTSYDEERLKFLQKLFEELRHLILIRIKMNEELLNNIDRIFKEINDVIFAYTINYFKKLRLENKNFSEKLDFFIQRILSSHNNSELKDSFANRNFLK